MARSRSQTRAVLPALVVALSLAAAAAQAQDVPPYLNFESAPVRPVALSPDGSRLFVANIPDARVEVFQVTMAGLTHERSIQVGLEPVAVAARSASEVWVVNHLSDSVSVVDVDAGAVRRTLLVGDEPRDIVFAAGRAFITTAHRGQHRSDPSIASVPGAGDPRLTTPGVGRADVWVFDVADPGSAFGGTPDGIVTLFGDTPRALAVSADGATVYAAIYTSGNQTTVVHEAAVCDGFASAEPCTVLGLEMPGGNPGPSANADGEPAPEVGLIVKWSQAAGAWLDELERDWSEAVRFSLPDYDVFSIDAATLEVGDEPFTGVGTTLFNMAVNPASGALYVAGTEAQNHVRFEGPGDHGGTTVQGHLAKSRVTVIDGGVATPRHLNPHIDYGVLPAPPGTAQHSLSTPLQIEVSADGSTAYVAAYGSGKIGVIPTVELESGDLDPTALSAGYLDTGGGPAGFALDEARGRIYVYTRWDNRVEVLDLLSGEPLESHTLPNPEPAAVTDGRRFLYDASLTSSNGEASCASCHPFGDVDHLAWDLGNPDDVVTRSPIPIRFGVVASSIIPDINGTGDPNDFHPMKGPMTTQTLRGLQFHGAQHWRGDRATGFYGTHAFDARLAFKNFIVAFTGLVGRAELPSDEDMDAFADFAMTLVMPPNPVRRLDNQLTAAQQAAFDFYTSDQRLSDGNSSLGFNCEGCHSLRPELGEFGTDGQQSFENERQIIKVAQLRNLYTKVGMFGMVPSSSFFDDTDTTFMGPQVRGFGFLHDGSVDTLRRFFSATVFAANGPSIGFQSQQERLDMEELMLAYPGDLAPMVGQQVTLDGSGEGGARFQAMLAAAERPFVSKLLGGEVTECDLIAKEAAGDRVRGYLYQDGMFATDDGSTPLSPEALTERAGAGTEITFTCAVPGTGTRLGLDRDDDGVFDGVDDCQPGLDPACTDDGDGDDEGDDEGGCGCRSAGGGAGSLWLALLGVLAVRRRRRRRAS